MSSCIGVIHRPLAEMPPAAEITLSDANGVTIAALCADCYALSCAAVLITFLSEATEPVVTVPPSRSPRPQVDWARELIYQVWLLGKAALWLTSSRQRAVLIMRALVHVCGDAIGAPG